MATLPDTPEVANAVPDVDQLFPEQLKSVDELFPVSIERDRYRRQTLGTSPIQDLIFGNSEVNPAARVLDAFGQGFKHGWGSEPAGLSKESVDYLKSSGVFNDYDKGQKSIIKAANESLFRGAATQVVDPIMRGLPGLFGGVQAATAQIGAEAGQEKLGREAAGAFEAFPAGLRAPTGIPHAAPHPMLAEIERAKSLGVIGEGEAGYFGTKPTEVTAPISGPQETPRRTGMPVDLFETPREASAAPMAEVPKAEAAPEPAPIAADTGPGPRPIAEDVTQKLIAAGRPEAEASASAELIASHYEARAERFNGERGTAEEMYKADGAEIRSSDGAAPAKSEPIEPEPSQGLKLVDAPEGGIYTPEQIKTARGEKYFKAVDPDGNVTAEMLIKIDGDTARIEDILNPAAPREAGIGTIGNAQLRGLISQFREQHPEITKITGKRVSGARAGGEYSLTGEHTEISVPLASKRGRAGADPQTWSLYEFLAKEGGLKPTADLQSIFGGKNPFVPGFGPLMRKGGLTMDEALTRAKENSYILDPNDIQHAPGAANKGELTRSVNDLHDMIAEESRGRKNFRNDQAPKEKAINPEEERSSIIDDLHRQVKETGGDVRHIDGALEDRVVELIQKEHTPDVMTAYEQAIMEVEYNQIKRGKINFRGDAKPVITLFKDANASTFVHETGHHWLEELMADSEHAKAPEALKADAIAVLDWLGVKDADAIKTSHHEKFARGFERYMMEGKAPNQALANVFAKFKDWLTKIYQTVTRLKSPINDEIRGVFDRLLTMHPSEVKIEPEGPPKTFADIHEADATHTAPEASHPVAETIQAERDMLATEHIPEEHDARLEGVTSKADRREAGGPQPVRDVNEAGPVAKEGGNDQAAGAVGEGGSNAPAESARPSVGGGKTEPPVEPQAAFEPPPSPVVDKAGNIRLENINAPEDILQVLRDSAARNNDFMEQRRGVMTDADELRLADAMGVDVAYLNTKKIGEAWNKKEIFGLEKLLIQSATSVRDAMAGGDVLAYADAKARHLMIHDFVQGKASAARAEAGRALQAFAALKKMKGASDAQAMSEFLKANSDNKTLFQLEREMKLGSQLDTPAKVSKFVNDSVKPTWSDKIIELWMSFLLSGPKTQVANILGNTITDMLRPVETTLAAGIGKARNLVTGSQDRVLFGEASAELFGMIHGSREGVVAAYKAFKTEEPQLTAVNQIERSHPKAIGGITGKVARVPLRLLGAEDEFFKAVAFRGDINRQAYALASKENLPKEQFNVRVAELSTNPTEEMVAAAKGVADYQTFQTPLGKVGRSIQQFSNSHPLAKVILPFVRTPLNLLKYAGERTPLGVFSSEVRDNLSGKNGAVARDTQISRIAIGTMVGVATLEMASQGLITGGGPADPKEKAILRANGWQEYSVKIGDMYYSYKRLDPFSMILGVVADGWEISKSMNAADAEKHNIPALLFGSISKTLLERASLRGASDMIQAVTQFERFGDGYIRNMVGTAVPAISAQTAQAIDPIVRETRTVLDNLKSRIPFMSETLHPKRDVWGEPVVREGGLGPDIASPIAETRLKNDPVNQALIDARYFPAKLNRKINGVELNDQQYDDYARIAGRMAKVRLDAMVNIIGNPNVPEVARHDMIQKTITSSRAAAQSLIIMQSINGDNNIMKKAYDAKIAKFRGTETAH